MDRVKSPPLLKSNTYHIIAQDDMDGKFVDDLKDKPARRPVVTERPLSCASFSSSTTLQEKRDSTRSLSNRHRRRKKPLPGDRIHQCIRRVPLFIKGAVVVILSGLPFAIFTGLSFTRFRNDCIGLVELGVTYKDFAMYLDIGWATLLVIVALAEVVSRFFSWLCCRWSVTTKYAPLANTLSFRITLMLWIGAMRLATCRMWPVSMEEGHMKNWVYQLRLILEFLAIAAFIFVVQGTLLQLIAVQYVQGYIGPRSERAMNELETLQKLNELLQPRLLDDKARIVPNLVQKLFLPPKNCVFDAIRKGHSSDEEVMGYAAILWTTVAGNKPVLTHLDIFERLVVLRRDPEGAEELFELLDRDGNNIVSKQEFQDLVLQVALQLKNRAAAMQGITRLLGKLEIMFSMVLIGAIIFVYSMPMLPFIPRSDC